MDNEFQQRLNAEGMGAMVAYLESIFHDLEDIKSFIQDIKSGKVKPKTDQTTVGQGETSGK